MDSLAKLLSENPVLVYLLSALVIVLLALVLGVLFKKKAISWSPLAIVDRKKDDNKKPTYSSQLTDICGCWCDKSFDDDNNNVLWSVVVIDHREDGYSVQVHTYDQRKADTQTWNAVAVGRVNNQLYYLFYPETNRGGIAISGYTVLSFHPAETLMTYDGYFVDITWRDGKPLASKHHLRGRRLKGHEEHAYHTHGPDEVAKLLSQESSAYPK